MGGLRWGSLAFNVTNNGDLILLKSLRTLAHGSLRETFTIKETGTPPTRFRFQVHLNYTSARPRDVR